MVICTWFEIIQDKFPKNIWYIRSFKNNIHMDNNINLYMDKLIQKYQHIHLVILVTLLMYCTAAFSDYFMQSCIVPWTRIHRPLFLIIIGASHQKILVTYGTWHGARNRKMTCVLCGTPYMEIWDGKQHIRRVW